MEPDKVSLAMLGAVWVVVMIAACWLFWLALQM